MWCGVWGVDVCVCVCVGMGFGVGGGGGGGGRSWHSRRMRNPQFCACGKSPIKENFGNRLVPNRRQTIISVTGGLVVRRIYEFPGPDKLTIAFKLANIPVLMFALV